VTGAMRKTIDAFATTAYILMFGIQWRDRVSNLDVLKMVGRDPLMMTVVKTQLRKLGHNLRKNCMTIPHTSSLSLSMQRHVQDMPLHGKRKRGRPRLQYM